MTIVRGKTVLITGAAMGMGREMAFLFAKDGARLALWDINREKLEKTVSELKNITPEVASYEVDLADTAKTKQAADAVHREIGAVDILVNNAGFVAAGLFQDVPIEKHIKTININTNAVMLCTHLFLPDMIQKKEGHIVNMASAAGLMAVPDLTSYSASKFAVVGFTESLRMELRQMKLKEIHTTTVCPSLVTTGMFDGMKAPTLSPTLTPQQMASKIFDGVKKNKIYVKAPFIVNTIPLTKALLPPNAFAFVNETLKVNTALDTWKGHGE